MKPILIFSFSVLLATYTFAQTDSLAKPNSIQYPSNQVMEEMPGFPGGEEALLRFVNKNLIIPKGIKKEKLHGKVYVSFDVDSTGTIQHIKISKGFRQDIDDAAMDVISKMPAWKPGKQNGRPVNVSFRMPVAY